MQRLILMSLLCCFSWLQGVSQEEAAWREAVGAEARRILDYWSTHAVDRSGSGFHGRVDLENRPDRKAARSAVLNTRILWTYSAAGRHFQDESYRPLADRAFVYLLEHFVDPIHGGVYWSVQPDGGVEDPSKQVYAQSFAIYAFAEYYHWTGEARALEEATRIYDLLQTYALDTEYGGYLEAFHRDWTDSEDRYLTGGEAGAEKTMNTHLHLLEAFSKLYEVWPRAELRQRLEDMIGIFQHRIYDGSNGHLELFFARDWTVLGDYISFGHDIEASWLLMEAAERLGHQWPETIRPLSMRMAETSLEEGLDADGALLYEAEPHGLTRTEKSWWPQAEAMVGFYQAYQLSGEARYHLASRQVWGFIDAHLADREGGEWFSMLDRDRLLLGSNDKVSAWKAPYHNTRACLEMHRRLGGGH